MKQIKSQERLEVDESYLIFMGYDYSPSGFDIGTFNFGGCFEMQTNGDSIPFSDDIKIYTLPCSN